MSTFKVKATKTTTGMSKVVIPRRLGNIWEWNVSTQKKRDYKDTKLFIPQLIKRLLIF